MNINPFYWPTLLLAVVLYCAGLILMRRVNGLPGRVWLGTIAVALAMPGFLFSFYYLHFLGEPVWLYAFRAVPGTELTAAGMGLLAGMVQALLPPKRLLITAWVPAALVVLLGWLTVPYVKMILTPLHVDSAQAEWQQDVCIQSTGATCGPASAATLLHALGMPVTEAALARECYTSAGGTENWYLVRALRRRGLIVRLIQTPPEPEMLPVGVIAGVRLNSPRGPGHFIAVLRRDGDRYTVGDPLVGLAEIGPGRWSPYHFTGFFIEIRRSEHPSQPHIAAQPRPQ